MFCSAFFSCHAWTRNRLIRTCRSVREETKKPVKWTFRFISAHGAPRGLFPLIRVARQTRAIGMPVRVVRQQKAKRAELICYIVADVRGPAGHGISIPNGVKKYDKLCSITPADGWVISYRRRCCGYGPRSINLPRFNSHGFAAFTERLRLCAWLRMSLNLWPTDLNLSLGVDLLGTRIQITDKGSNDLEWRRNWLMFADAAASVLIWSR